MAFASAVRPEIGAERTSPITTSPIAAAQQRIIRWQTMMSFCFSIALLRHFQGKSASHDERRINHLNKL